MIAVMLLKKRVSHYLNLCPTTCRWALASDLRESINRGNQAWNFNKLDTQGLKGTISKTIGFEPDALQSIGHAEELLFVI